MHASQPIGIFDSGIGGLAVARIVKDLLPNESICYVGDTEHLPYGEKKTSQLQTYTKHIANWLVQQNCKVILIACNTATAAVVDILQEQLTAPISIVNVIDPVINYVEERYSGQNIGLIGTNYTIRSGIYTKKFHAEQSSIRLKSLATPLLVPMIEEGYVQEDILKDYLSHAQLKDIQTLILGCTHYILVKSYITHFYQGKMVIIDGATITAEYLKKFLLQQKMQNIGKQLYTDRFVATRLTQSFQISTKRYFGQQACLQLFR